MKTVRIECDLCGEEIKGLYECENGSAGFERTGRSGRVDVRFTVNRTLFNDYRDDSINQSMDVCLQCLGEIVGGKVGDMMEAGQLPIFRKEAVYENGNSEKANSVGTDYAVV